jgi:hypothetical protein
MAALRILTNSEAPGSTAALRIAILLTPFLLLFRAAWGIFEPLRTSIRELAGSWAPMIAVLLISLIPIPFSRFYNAERAVALAGAEELLGWGQDLTLEQLPNLDLTLTPAICASAKKALAAKGQPKPFDDDPIRIEDAEREIAPSIKTLRWLLANGCDCKPEISGLVQAVNRFARSSRCEKLLAGLAAVR